MALAVTLYRGDSVPPVGGGGKDHRGRTFADYFLGNGLMARHADLGDPKDLEGRDLVDLVLDHVGFDRGHEETYRADHSPLLAFSTSQETGMRYANRRLKSLEPCNFEDATCFLWRFEPSLQDWETAGSFYFQYRADPCNCQALVSEKLERGTAALLANDDLLAFGQALGEQLVLDHAAADTRTHLAIVIDVGTFLAASDLSGRDKRRVRNSISRSKRDNEWLVMPADPMPDGKGFDARMPMNAALFADAWFRRQRRAGVPRA